MQHGVDPGRGGGGMNLGCCPRLNELPTISPHVENLRNTKLHIRRMKSIFLIEKNLNLRNFDENL